MLSRRCFMKSGGLALVGFGWIPRFLERVAAAETGKKGKILVTIFQRGAADGLNIVVPFGETAYYNLRPTIAVPAPSSGAERSALDLDGFFGFHPVLRPLLDVYKAGHLAVIHAAGSPDNTRSHFDAQDYMETATPGVKSTRDGWLNRYLLAKPDPEASPFRAVCLTASMPRTLQGRSPAIAMGSIGDFDLKVGPFSEGLRNGFESL